MVGKVSWWGVLLAAASIAQPLTLAAAAEAVATTTAEAVEDSIVITGRRTEVAPIRIMLDFIDELGDPVAGSFGFARLEDHLCIKVHNLNEAASDFLVQRMAALAEQVDMDGQKPNCPPNLDIIFTTDGKAMATHLRENEPFLLRPFGNTEGTTQGLHALGDFVNSEMAIRWWQITVPVDYVGNIAVKVTNADAPPTMASANSLISNSVRSKLLGTIVIVDMSKTGDISWSQLADYVAMVAMTQVNPKANLAGYDSILNLFGTAASKPPELTAWDKAYLRALYSINLYMLPKAQKGQLAHALLRNLEE